MRLPGEHVSESSEHYYTSILGQQTREEVRRRYSAPKRKYHTWEHVREMFRVLEHIDESLECLPAVILATVYHDIVYDPKRKDNELRSATVMRRMSKGMELFWIERADALIMATADHRLPAGAEAAGDAAHFLDMDLAILGSPAERYARYARDLRLEYDHMTTSQWAAGRKVVLQEFLRRLAAGELFNTSWAKQGLAGSAELNIRWELENLGKSVGDMP